MKELTRQNFAPMLKAFLNKSAITPRRTAKAIGCSEATFTRLLVRTTFPSDEMLRQGGAMIEIGFRRYSKLSKAEKEKISAAMGTVGGGAIGFGSITAAV